MLDNDIIEILLERIQNCKINPVTSQPFKVEDIKIEKFKTAVEEKLTVTQTA